MAKQLNINLAMTANVSQAKGELQSLSKMLDDLMVNAANRNDFGISTELQKSVSLATQLKTQLTSATMSNGNLDLSKFNLELQKSGLKIKDYKNALVAMGPAGTQAFQKLASSIMSAEVPLRRANTLLLNFATTLKNTARWQISSSILHGFMGAIQGAYGYAQDLNESLNNIRIVTGQSVEQMSKFADQANRAAKELSATTTAYTDAALIYYQQGLDDETVKARTDVTIKMANVSRQSAEEVSNQMTAIWNNFDNGSKSLEYYADVITALGAATASSSEEIATGLEKFSAVAETVGLSYEYATSALATITATTRQSADVVGTALKTLFARIQDLELGKTLEDGTTLGKYSAALNTIGVNIKDINGEVKNMDSILDELGAKWNTIAKDEQIALAQTVAGTRQYAQLIALMDNWDFMKTNLQTAEGSAGTLQKQADIYAESWEAAQKRVKAAAQSIYSDLLDDKFFINLLNGFEKVLSTIDNFIDGIGGVKSVLLLLGSIVTQVFGQQITASLRNTIDNFKMMSAAGREAVMQLRKDATAELLSAAQGQTRNTNEGQGITAAYSAQANLQQQLITNSDRMTESEKAQAQLLIDINKSLGQSAIAAGKEADAQAKVTKQLERQMMFKVTKTGSAADVTNVKKAQEQLSQAYQKTARAQDIYYQNLNQKIDKSNIEGYVTDIKKMAILLQSAKAGGEEFQQCLKNMRIAISEGNMDALSNEFERFATFMDAGVVPSTQRLQQALQNAGLDEKAAAEEAKRLSEQYFTQQDAAAGAAEANKRVGDQAEIAGEQMSNMTGKTGDATAGFTAFTSVIMSLSAAINAFKNIGNILSNDDLSTGEKMVQMFSALAMVIPLVTSLTKAGALADMSAFARKVLHIGAIKEETAAVVEEAAAEGASVAPKAASAAATWALVWPVLALTAALAAVIALIVLFVKAWQDYQKTTPEGKLKTTQEAAAKLKDTLDDTKTKADNLRQAFDSYNSIREKLDNCVKGTQEWRDTLAEVNDKVLEIMQEYPDLVGYMNISSENGQLVIHNIEEILERADLATQHLQAATISTNAQAHRAQLGIDKSNVISTYGQVVEPDGTGWVDEAEYAAASEQRALVKTIVENATDYLGTSFKDFSDKFGEDLNLADDELLRFYYAIQSIGQESNNVANELDAAAKAVAASAIGEQYGNLDGAIQDALATIASKDYQSLYDAKYEEVIGISQRYSRGDRKNDLETDINSIWNRYLAAIGEDRSSTSYRLDDNAIQGNDQNRTYHFYNGTEETSITEEEMARIVAASEAMGELGDSATVLADVFATMDKGAQDFATTLINSKDANNEFHPEEFLQSLTLDQIQTIINGIEGNTITADAREAMGGISLEEFNALATAMGMAGSKLLDILDTGAASVEEDFQKISETLTTTPKQIFEATLENLNDLSYNEAQQLAHTYQEIFNNGGAEALSTFDAMIQSVGTEYSRDFAAIMSNADWSDWDVDKAIIDQLNEKEIPIPDGFEDFISAMRASNNAIKHLDITAFREKVADTSKILSSLKEWGSTISAEDFAKLGEGYDDYFTLMADGTYKLTGDAKAFYDEVTKKQREELLGNISSAAELESSAQTTLDNVQMGGYSLSELSSSALYQDDEGKNRYNKERLNAQIDFIKSMSAENDDVISDWTKDIADGSVQLETFEAVNQAMAEAISKYNELDNSIEENQKIQQESVETLLSTATSLEDLNTIRQLMIDSGIDATQYEQDFSNETRILGVEAAQTATSMEALQRIQNEYGLSAQDVGQKALELTNSIVDLNNLAQQGYIDLEQYNNKIKELANNTANNASTLEELQNGLGQLGGTFDFVSGKNGETSENNFYDEYAQGLLNIASNYDSCSEAAAEYQSALTALSFATAEGSNATKEQIEALEKAIRVTEEHLEVMIQAEEAAEKYDLEAASLTAQMHEIAEAEGVTEKAALAMAVANQRMNKGVKALNENWEDWKKTLKTTDKTSQDYADTLVDLSEAVTDLVGWYDDLNLDSKFVEKNMKLIDKAAQGDTQSILELGAAVASTEIKNAKLNETLANGAKQIQDIEGNISSMPNAFQEWGGTFDDLQTSLSSMFDTIQNRMSDLANGTSLADVLMGEGGIEAFVEQLNAYAAATGMTANEMQQMLESVGVTADVKSVQQEQDVQTPVYEEHSIVTGWENAQGVSGDHSIFYSNPIIKRYSIPMGTETHKGIVDVASISMDKDGANWPTFTGKRAASPSATSGGKSGGGGGGGSSRKAAEPKQQNERYHVITKEIDSLTKVYDRLSKAKDRAFGANRLKLMQEESKNIQDQIDKQEELIGQVKAYMEIDKGNLQHGSGSIKGLDYYGLEAQYDIDGNITNWDAIQAAALAEVNKQIGRYNSGLIDEDAKEAAEKQYEGFLELVNQYEETNEKFQDEMDKQQDLVNQWQDLNYEKMNYELEIKLKLNNNELKRIEYQIKALGDSFFSSAEALSHLFSLEGSSKASATMDGLEIYKQRIVDLNEAYERGEISQDAYIEGLEDARDGLYDSLDAILDLNEEMKEYYANTLSKAADEMARYTDQIEHNISVTEHLRDILSLMGKETDYTAMGYLLNSQYEQTQQAYAVSKQYAEVMKNQRDAAQAAYDQALAEGNTAALENLKANLDAAVEAANGAEDQALSDLQRMLETGNQLIENNLLKAKQNIDNLATGGKGWDYINQVMDLAERASDRYLTKTNQIYETNKLLRTVQQDIDKTTNNTAKQKLANFTKEIEALQKTTKLSKNELEIAKAQYEVLKAQIALEDARNAKSTVRLQRDSEGNYGYVYTADQDKVNDALSELEGKQNDLYNLAREQEQAAAQDLLKLAEERSQAIYDLEYEYYVKRSISEEEFLARRVELEKYYNDISESITKDHITSSAILTQTSATGANDTWTSGMQGLLNNNYTFIPAAGEFAQKLASITGDSIENVNQQITDFNEQAKQNSDEIIAFMTDAENAIIPIYKRQTETFNESQAGLNNYKNTADAASQSTANLAAQLTGEDGLIAQIDAEATAVRESTTEWAYYFATITEEVIPAVMGLAEEIDRVIELASKQIDVNVVTHYSLDGLGAGGYTGSYSNYSSNGSGSGGSGSGSGSKSSNGGKSNTTSSAKTKSGGCFVAGTQIIMSDYTVKNIEDIKVNELVIAYNEEKDWFEAKRVTKAYVHHDTPRIIDIYLSNGHKMGITPGHPVMTINGWKSRDIENSAFEHGVVATMLNVGDTIIGFGMNVTVVEIKERQIPEHYDSYNIEVEDLHTYIADNIVVHNLKAMLAWDTGGYTGTWDGLDTTENGKLAFLHQKELVLNADDTENMLAAVKLIRQISGAIDLRAASANNSSGIISPSYQGAEQILEQEVTIHAEFPNATNHSEIEEAFNNLVNRASQYAGRHSSIKEY